MLLNLISRNTLKWELYFPVLTWLTSAVMLLVISLFIFSSKKAVIKIPFIMAKKVIINKIDNNLFFFMNFSI